MGIRSQGIGIGVMSLVCSGLFLGISLWIRYGIGADWEEVTILLVFGVGFLVGGLFFLIDAGIDLSYFRGEEFFDHAARASALAPLLALFAAIMAGLGSGNSSISSTRPLAPTGVLTIVRIVVTFLSGLGFVLGLAALVGISRHSSGSILSLAKIGLAVNSAILALMLASWLF